MQDATNVVASTTPAGGGDISPAPAGPATSQLYSSTAGAAGVVEPPTPEASPAAAGSDEIDVKELFELQSDETANDYQSTFGIDNKGNLTIKTTYDGAAMILVTSDTCNLYKFLTKTINVWSA